MEGLCGLLSGHQPGDAVPDSIDSSFPLLWTLLLAFHMSTHLVFYYVYVLLVVVFFFF